MTASRTPTNPATVGFANLLQSELTKLRTVRSTYWTMAVAILGSIGIGTLICARYAAHINEGHPIDDGFDPTVFSLSGLYLAQLAIGTLGVLVISSEYGTGMIRATFVTVPQRRAVLAAKIIVFATVVLIAGEAMSFSAFGIGQALLASAHLGASLTDPAVLRATIGGGLYLTVVGLLGLGLGGAVKHTAGALSAFFGVLFASTAAIDLLPTTWRNHAIKYMPANAGTQILNVQRPHDMLTPWTGFGVFCLYAVAATTIATVVIRRDT